MKQKHESLSRRDIAGNVSATTMHNASTTRRDAMHCVSSVWTKTVLCLFFVMATIAANAQFSGSGSGTLVDPYLITSDTELEEVRNDLTAFYRLDADITVNAWIPFGTFTGNFDGNGHTVTISSLGAVPLSGTTYFVGLFGELGSSGSIRNLKVEGTLGFSENGANSIHIGGIVGRNNGGTIQNCVSTAGITVSGDAVSAIDAGGIVGYNSIGTIANCYSLSNVSADNTGSSPTGRSNAGGVVGASNATISACYATGSVHATSTSSTNNMSGGISGLLSPGTIANCVALNAGITIKAGDTSIGRIAGYLSGTSTNNRAIAISSLPNGTLTDKNGLLITSAQAQTQTTYATDAGWAFGATDTDPWVWSPGLLRPVLYWETYAVTFSVTGGNGQGRRIKISSVQ